MMILAYIRFEMLMENGALIALPPIIVPSYALQITMIAPPELIQMAARNNLFVLNVQGTRMINVALQRQTAQLFAKLTRRNAKHPEQMTMDAQSLLFALFKSVITTENFATYIAQVYAMTIRYYAPEEEMKTAAKKHPSANH
jgi:hypothetical protein